MSRLADYNAAESEPTAKAEQIMDAAKRLFLQQGFGATSMDAIAQAAGVSKATVYAYYPSKGALFAASTRRECRRLMAQMSIPENIGEQPLGVALRRIARSYVSFVFSEEPLGLLRMVISEVARCPEVGEIFLETGPSQSAMCVAGYIRRARDAGLVDVDDCDMAAGQFIGMLRGGLHIPALLGHRAEAHELSRLIEEAVQTFVARYATPVLQ